MRRTYSPRDVMHTLARRRWVVLVPVAIGLAAAGPASTALSGGAVYRSEVALTAPTPSPVRLSAIEARLTDEALDAIADELGLRTSGRAEAPDDALADMRRNMDVRAGERSGSFRISYVSEDPETARRVAERLAAVYVTPAAGASAGPDRETLENEIAEAGRRVAAHERKLAEFQRRQSDQVRSQLQGSLQAVQKTQLQLQAVRNAAAALREQRAQVERQLAEAQARPSGPAQPDPVSTIQQLGQARAQLQLLRLRLPADHPDVLTLERTILEIEAKAAQDTARGGAAAAPPAPDIQARLRELKDELRSLDQQLSAEAAEEARLRRVLEQQTNTGVPPDADEELSALTREYERLQSTHSALLARRDAPAAAAAPQPSESTGTFTMVAPASAAVRTSGGSSLAMLASPLMGLLVGLVSVGVLERRDSSFRREGEVRHALGLPVLAMVPDMLSDTERQLARRRTLTTDLAGAAALVASVVLLVWWQG